MKQISRILTSLFAFFVCILLSGCFTKEEDLVVSNGNTGLRLSLGNVSTDVVTRLAPNECDKPSASQFKVNVHDDTRNRTLYNDNFSTSVIPAPPGNYTITATCGQNPDISIDAPYYIGTATATIGAEDTEATDVNVTCKVGNALVSVKFGKDDEEKARLDKFYSDYKVRVSIGDLSMDIEKSKSTESVYFKAGSSISLTFIGKLKSQDSKEVEYPLTSESIPAVFNAADHAIITISPAPTEYPLHVDITEVELVEATLEETIPLSWLPVPIATPVHQYDSNGDLVGTNVTFSNSYPGMEWKTIVTNASGVEVRSAQGTGELMSEYASQEWPYLPVGNYTATYYLVNGDKFQKVSSRDFIVSAPDIKVSVEGYTSYSKYLEGDVDAANGCDAFTIYSMSAHVNIAQSLLGNSHYNYSGLNVKLNGGDIAGTLSGNTYTIGNQTGKNPSLDAYVLSCSSQFAGISMTDSKDLYITGLPATFAPPSKSNGWTKGSGTVTFSSNELKLGHRGGLLTEENEYVINNSSVAIPSRTKFCMDYNIMIHPATMGTTFTVTDNAILTIFTQQQNGGLANNNDYPYQGTTETVTANSAITTLKLNNSYGGGQTRTHVYSLTFKYGS